MGRVLKIIRDPNFKGRARQLLCHLRWKTILSPMVKERTAIRTAFWSLKKLNEVFLKYTPVETKLFKTNYPDRINRTIRFPTRMQWFPKSQEKIVLPCFGLVKNAGNLNPIEAVMNLKYIKMSLFEACTRSDSTYLGCSVPPLKSAIYCIDQADEWTVRCRQAYNQYLRKEKSVMCWMDQQDKMDFERLIAHENNKPFQQFLLDRQTGEGWQVYLPLDIIMLVEKFTSQKDI